MENSDESSTALAPRRPWWRLHKSTLAVIALAVAFAALWNVSAFLRHRPLSSRTEWHYGWPSTFLRREYGGWEPGKLTENVLEFNAFAFVANAIAVAALVAVLAVLVERRRRRGRLLQVTLRELAVTIAVFAALLAWFGENLKAQRREVATVSTLHDSLFVVSIDQGTPYWLRSWLPRPTPPHQFFGTDIRLFDRVRGATIGIGPQVPEELSQLSEFPHLAWLTFWPARKLRDEDFQRVRDLRQLVSLDCRESPLLTDAALPSLAELTKLQVLRLTGDGITSAGLRHLRGLTAMRELTLNDTDVDNAGLEQLAEMRDLEILELRQTYVTGGGLRRLRHLSKLRVLDVRGSGVSAAGAAELQRALPELRILTGQAPTIISDTSAARLR